MTTGRINQVTMFYNKRWKPESLQLTWKLY